MLFRKRRNYFAGFMIPELFMNSFNDTLFDEREGARNKTVLHQLIN